jgi:hypothetical protein|mmetsp:Transcript_71038/g.111190  ORF Transcript_71038/g.111190 Transcript_71038/m.111190 type:complete len:288 (-) Transcript_71038:155-1018(-)
MASLYGTESMPSTETIGSYQSSGVHPSMFSVAESTPVGFFMNSFLDRCLSEDMEAENGTWGESNDRSLTDIEMLARHSIEGVARNDAHEESPTMARHEQQELAEADSSGRSITDVENVGQLSLGRDTHSDAREGTPVVSAEHREVIAALCRDQPDAALALRAFLNGTASSSFPELPESDAIVAFQALQGLAGLLNEGLALTEVEETKTNVPPVPALRYVQRCSRRTTLKRNQKEVCPICLEKLSKTEKVQTLPCSHKLHTSCCNAYFRTPGVKPMCPFCRFDMTEAV